jgi:hypothetical protein
LLDVAVARGHGRGANPDQDLVAPRIGFSTSASWSTSGDRIGCRRRPSWGSQS